MAAEKRRKRKKKREGTKERVSSRNNLEFSNRGGRAKRIRKGGEEKILRTRKGRWRGSANQS